MAADHPAWAASMSTAGARLLTAAGQLSVASQLFVCAAPAGTDGSPRPKWREWLSLVPSSATTACNLTLLRAVLQQRHDGTAELVAMDDGVHVDTMFFRAHTQGPVPTLASDVAPVAGTAPRRAVLLVCPNAGLYEFHYLHSDLVPLYLSGGVDVMVYNYRGYGRSGGKPVPSRLQKDAMQLVAHLRARWGVDVVAVHSESIGSIVSTYLARRGAVQLLVVDRAFSDLHAVAWTLTGWWASWALRLFMQWQVDNVLHYLAAACPKILLCDPGDAIILNSASLKVGVAEQLRMVAVTGAARRPTSGEPLAPVLANMCAWAARRSGQAAAPDAEWLEVLTGALRTAPVRPESVTSFCAALQRVVQRLDAVMAAGEAATATVHMHAGSRMDGDIALGAAESMHGHARSHSAFSACATATRAVLRCWDGCGAVLSDYWPEGADGCLSFCITFIVWSPVSLAGATACLSAAELDDSDAPVSMEGAISAVQHALQTVSAEVQQVSPATPLAPWAQHMVLDLTAVDAQLRAVLAARESVARWNAASAPSAGGALLGATASEEQLASAPAAERAAAIIASPLGRHLGCLVPLACGHNANYDKEELHRFSAALSALGWLSADGGAEGGASPVAQPAVDGGEGRGACHT